MANQMQQRYVKLGETVQSRMEKVNSELLALTYGSLVTQLLKDFESVQSVNAQLKKMGVNIGCRLIEEFLAKCNIGPCQDFKETAEVIAKVALKMFLGVTAEVADWSADGCSCSLLVADNPLTDFVEIPPSLSGLSYSNLLCGVIKGALEQVYMKVECAVVKDVLRGDEITEFRLDLKEILREEFIDDEEEEAGNRR